MCRTVEHLAVFGMAGRFRLEAISSSRGYLEAISETYLTDSVVRTASSSTPPREPTCAQPSTPLPLYMMSTTRDIHERTHPYPFYPKLCATVCYRPDRIHFLETELGDRKEESRRKDHIIAALTQRIPELEPASERREYSQRPTEHVDRGTTDSSTDRGTTRISTTESRRPRWAFLLRDLVSASRRVRRGVRRG